jgi:outer membrane protein OmpA-like peptidoglycan-associated protein
MNKTSPPVTAILAIIVAMALSGCQSMPRAQALTIALTATSADPAPDLDPLTSVVREHAAAALLPGDGKVTVVTLDETEVVDLTPMRGQDVESVSAAANRLITSNLDALRAVLGKAASAKDGLDVIGTLDRALEQTPSGGHVILESSGYSTVAPVDLNKAGDWIGNPDGFVRAVNPDDLPNATGKHITFAGLGYPNPASTQEQAAPAARTALTKIMLGLCAKMHAATCDTITGPAGQEPATAANKVPQVILNQITTHCVGQTNIDASIAFEPYSAMLLPVVDAILAPIAESLTRCPSGTLINATGYSALLPGQATDTDLERNRAKAVLNRLTALGAPVTCIGTAAAGGQIINNLPHGIYDETLAAKNRTVTLSITW